MNSLGPFLSAISYTAGLVSVSWRCFTSHPKGFLRSNQLEGSWRLLNSVWDFMWVARARWVLCCVPIQCLHPSEEHFNGNYATMPLKGCHNLKAPPNAARKCGLHFGGCTATILRGIPYPKVLCAPKKEERKKENGDITWRRSSLLQAWVAEIVT